ncbi:MAG: TIGR03943 family protein [Bacilli bacterium]|nr:TIGR03943 family protein [Bacilli bacterium]
MKRFLGIICLLYTSIIIYVKASNKLNNYLAPNMQMYILLSIIPLILMGLIMIFNNNIKYKFKISDLILLLPLLMLAISGDGRLSMTLASNRSSSFATQKKEAKKEIKPDKEEVNNEITESSTKEYDFNKIDFDVKDESYTMLVDYITYGDNNYKYIGKTVKIRGFTVIKNNFIPDGFFAIGKYAVSCCAADANFIGLISKYNKSEVKNNTWYEVEGILKRGKDKEKIDILYLEVINIKEIKEEEQYVYPCYVYGDDKCIEISKYNLGN